MRRSSISWNSRRAKPYNSLQWTIAAGHERVRLAGQVLPAQPGPLRQAQPLLHRGALVGVEALALTRGDQLVDPYPGQLDHEVPAHEHREDLAVDPQTARAEPGGLPRWRDPGCPDPAVHQLVVALIRADPPCHARSVTPTSDRSRRESLPSADRAGARACRAPIGPAPELAGAYEVGPGFAGSFRPSRMSAWPPPCSRPTPATFTCSPDRNGSDGSWPGCCRSRPESWPDCTPR